MVVKSWESVQGNQGFPHFMQGIFFECLAIACTKTATAELLDLPRLKDLNKLKIEELLYLLVFVWSTKRKGNLDSTGKKIRKKKNSKIACIGMWPRMHFLDLQHLYMFWTTGLTTAAK